MTESALGKVASLVSRLTLSAVAGTTIGCSLLFSPTSAAPKDSGPQSHQDANPNRDGAPANCPDNYSESFNGSRYRVADAVALSWYQAEETCESEGTHLAVVDSVDEHNFLAANQFVGWIGASDHVAEGVFRWVTGTELSASFENWGPDEPDNQFMTQDCVRISQGGFLWEDGSCDTQLAFVCECDAQAVADTWCRTGTDTDCDECLDDCLGLTCVSNFCAL